LAFKYGEHNLGHGESLRVGNLKIEALHTPGHTDESLCYAVYMPGNESEALLVFTGDTLFAGSVGRTDLYGTGLQIKQAEKLHESLNEKLLPMGDHVVIYPGHGAGSVCGNSISAREVSTLGYERKTNPYLQLDKEDFVKLSCVEKLIIPPYFKKMEEYNRNGPPLLSELALPRAMSIDDFEKEMQEPDMLVVDTRMPYAFAGSHIPGSMSIWIGGTSVYPGWLISVRQYLLFVHERHEDTKIVTARFRRVGLDNMCGYLCPNINEWQEAGKPIGSFGTMSVQQLRSKLAKDEITVLDVREQREWKEGYVKGAKRVFFGDLADKSDSLPKKAPTAVTCSVGNRSSIGASILKRKGFEQVYNVLGGMTAWKALGYPIERE
jgi:hydroxyacylglutathione hydrolase